METLALQITEISKKFSNHPRQVLEKITFSVQPGEIFGLLGPNGAGKTTLLKILATLIIPSSGGAKINGYDLIAQDEKIRSSIGVAWGDDRSFYYHLTGEENLQFFGSLYGLSRQQIKPRIQELYHCLKLDAAKGTKYQYFSTGMRQKLGLARALLPNPPILFIDELTRGIDPSAAIELHRWIKDELGMKQKKTVLLTTHSLDEAQAICSKLAILNQGRIFAQGNIAKILQQIGAESLAEVFGKLNRVEQDKIEIS